MKISDEMSNKMINALIEEIVAELKTRKIVDMAEVELLIDDALNRDSKLFNFFKDEVRKRIIINKE